jgi:hypothetical protein
MDDKGYFKNLDIGLLREFAAQWVKEFEYIEIDKIELRRYSTPREIAKHFDPPPKLPIIYAVVFYTLEKKLEDFFWFDVSEIIHFKNWPLLNKDALTTRYLQRIWFEESQRRHKRRVRGELKATAFEKFSKEIKYRCTLRNTQYPSLFGEDFKNVYHRGAFPGEWYLDQWTFIPLAQGENLPLSVENITKPVLLYTTNFAGEKNISGIQTTNPVTEPSAMSEMGRVGAHTRWRPHNDLMDEACRLADQKWADHYDSWHNEMAEHLIGLTKFKALKRHKHALMRKLIPIADKYGRTRGKKGIKKRKK